MREKLVIVPRVRSSKKKMVDTALLAITCVLIFCGLFVASFFIVAAAVSAVIWYVVVFYLNMEYEYTYYDGELSFARIWSKSRRKNLGEVQMDDVIALAPKGDRSVHQYENDRNVSHKDMTSGRADAKVYELVFKGEKGICRYEFEPDADMLDEICVKYGRVVVK